jgi:hypothetical protein
MGYVQNLISDIQEELTLERDLLSRHQIDMVEGFGGFGDILDLDSHPVYLGMLIEGELSFIADTDEGYQAQIIYSLCDSPYYNHSCIFHKVRKATKNGGHAVI